MSWNHYFLSNHYFLAVLQYVHSERDIVWATDFDHHFPTVYLCFTFFLSFIIDIKSLILEIDWSFNPFVDHSHFMKNTKRFNLFCKPDISLCYSNYYELASNKVIFHCNFSNSTKGVNSIIQLQHCSIIFIQLTTT